MFTASFHRAIDDPWCGMEPIRIGRIPRRMGEPNAYVTVAEDSRPYARIDAYAEFEGAFLQLIVWRATVVFGWSAEVHLVDPVARRTQSVACNGYFGQLYPLDSQLLIASASELICISAAWKEVWRRGELGVDGVTIDSVSNGTIEGTGEWNPPGGWRPFRLEPETGKSLIKADESC